MTDHRESEPGVLLEHECREWSEECGGEVQWQTDGNKRCLRHQSRHERETRRQRLVSWTVAAVIVATVGIMVNMLEP